MVNKKINKLDSKSQKLLNDLQSLHEELRGNTTSNYGRINPFVEDLFSWKERGDFAAKKKDANITIYNSTTIVGNVDIGDNTWIGPYCSLDGKGGLRIGSHCSISLGTQILTHDTVKWALSSGKHPYEYASTSIGNNCFIGSHAVISKGVTIGDFCVIGAGAIVLKNIESHSIVAGVPARKIGVVKIINDNFELVYTD